MQSLEDGILAFFLGKVVEAGGALFARGQGPRALVSEEVFSLAKTVQTTSGTVVLWSGRCRAQEERLLLDTLGELLRCGVG